MNVAFTLCSNNYLAQARILADSFKKHHPDIEFVIGLVDHLNAEIDYKLFSSAKILPFEKLGYSEFDEMQPRYDIVEFNTSVKPFYFEYFFKNGFSKAIYFDPDIKIFQPLSELWSNLDTYDVLLTPHTITPTHENSSKWQRVSNGVGIFNLGFLALAKSDNTATLLSWWKKKMETECIMWSAGGLFVDQIWAIYFPVYFQKSKILMDPGYNMAYWNFGERNLSFVNGEYYANDSKLKFFHFSNIKPDRPDIISGYSDYTFSQRPDLKDIYNDYFLELKKNKHSDYRKIKPTINLRPPETGLWKLTGRRIMVHGTRWLETTTKFVFGLD